VIIHIALSFVYGVMFGSKKNTLSVNLLFRRLRCGLYARASATDSAFRSSNCSAACCIERWLICVYSSVILYDTYPAVANYDLKRSSDLGMVRDECMPRWRARFGRKMKGTLEIDLHQETGSYVPE
jgi:hypothetical protein